MYIISLAHLGNASPRDREDFMKEFRTMTDIGSHPNVVSLLGACKHEGRPRRSNYGEIIVLSNLMWNSTQEDKID